MTGTSPLPGAFPKAGSYHRPGPCLAAVTMASTSQRSSSPQGLPGLRGEQAAWGQETPRNLKGWAEAKLGIHTVSVGSISWHWVPEGGGPGSGQEMTVHIYFSSTLFIENVQTCECEINALTLPGLLALNDASSHLGLRKADLDSTKAPLVCRERGDETTPIQALALKPSLPPAGPAGLLPTPWAPSGSGRASAPVCC